MGWEELVITEKGFGKPEKGFGNGLERPGKAGKA